MKNRIGNSNIGNAITTGITRTLICLRIPRFAAGY